jgi:release factor glutamine methyltransferase
MTDENKEYGPPWTVLKLLNWSKGFFAERGIESPRFDAERLLAHVLGIDRVRLYMEYDRPLVPDELDAYRALVKRRVSHEPVAYLVGQRGFWNLDLKSDRRALIPRPDTEVIVEEVLERIPEDADLTLVDVGTGTGAIALALKSERPGLRVLATDASADALALARENAELLELDVEFFEGDLLEAVPDDVELDYVVSNPPYVEEDFELAPEIRDHEPLSALLAGPEGLDVIRRLVPQAYARLNPGGWLTTEIGFRHGESVPEIFRDADFEDVSLRKDYNDQPRAVSGRRP